MSIYYVEKLINLQYNFVLLRTCLNGFSFNFKLDGGWNTMHRNMHKMSDMWLDIYYYFNSHTQFMSYLIHVSHLTMLLAARCS